ncbi:MAG: T9SS type A sorting domain-containing protein [Saprospiraceae bacterium]
MKNLYTLLGFLLLTTLCAAQQQSGFYQIRLTKPAAANTMHVQMRAVSSDLPTTDDFCSDIGFRLHWTNPTITSIDMVQASSIGAALNEQAVVVNGANKTQTIGFCAACNFFNWPSNWIVNKWVNLGTININGTGSASDFDIVLPDGQFPNIGNNFTDFLPSNGALPLNLLSFKAEKSGTKDALISWVTTNEENTSHFVVERSFDKKIWTGVGSVAAAGYSLGVEQYNFNDVGVYNGRDSHMTAYYRLQMVDQDAATKTSPIESVVFGTGATKGSEFLVYPNPSKDGIQVEWDANQINQPTALEFFNIEGKLVYSQKVSDNTDQEYIDFGHTNVIPGLYMLRIVNGLEPLDFKQIVVGQR